MISGGHPRLGLEEGVVDEVQRDHEDGRARRSDAGG
ncbi:MAG: hypothetical protein K0T00_2364, partial [Gaiellaceae bacterium]|nr:hypothetical protein [Gaiellaceae bacterium]